MVGFARSLLSSFWLVTEDKVIDLDVIAPVAFEKEAFCRDSETEMTEEADKDGILYTSYWRNFNSYEELHQLTGMELPRADLIKYGCSTVAVDFEHGYGHLSVDMAYQGTEFGANGMFAVDNFQQDGWGVWHSG